MSSTAPRTRSAHRTALSYIDASREYYAAHGYEQPYEWAVHDDVPFQPLGKPLAESIVGVVTTAFPHDAPMPKRATAVPTRPAPTSMFTADLSWHKEATHTDDLGTFLPLGALDRAGDRIAAVSDRFYCVPTEYSQRTTRADAERVVAWCTEDDVDVVVLVPL